MAKIKFNVSGADPKEAKTAGLGGDPPTPGVYKVKIKEMNPGYSKNSDTKKPDKTKPRVEVVFNVVEKGKFKGAPLWYYLTFGEGYPAVKLDQFLQAMGVTSAKKRKGEFDTDKLIGKTCKVRVKARKDSPPGEYQAEISGVLPADAPDEDDEPVEDDDADDEPDVDEDDDSDDDDDDDDDDSDDGDDDDDPDYDEMSVADLRKECKKRGLEPKGAKPALIERLTEDDDSDDGDDDDDDDDDGPF